VVPPHFQPRQHPQLVALMNRILERMQSDLLDALGLVITIHDKRHDEHPSVLAALGVGADFAMPSCLAPVARFPTRSPIRYRC
jgi:hypothetical protein